jgi:hypothetical protein
VILALALDYIVPYINRLMPKTNSLYPPIRTSFRSDAFELLQARPAAAHLGAFISSRFAGSTFGARVPCSCDEARNGVHLRGSTVRIPTQLRGQQTCLIGTQACHSFRGGDCRRRMYLQSPWQKLFTISLRAGNHTVITGLIGAN